MMGWLYAQREAIVELERVERRAELQERRLFRRVVRDAQDPFEIPENEFVRQFRLNKEACRQLINELEPYIPAGRYISKIPLVFKVVTTLNFFATGSYQRSIGSNVLACCSQSMVSRSIKEISSSIVTHLLRRWVRFPRNDAEKDEIKQRFVRHHHMHHIIGVVDGTHIAIVKPTENENVYVNRKGYHSLNCQVICDSELRILNVVARWPGSTHDAYIWRMSRIGDTMRANYKYGDQDTRIMGDSGYACLPWLLVPVTHPQDIHDEHFNEVFRRCRSIVERCIGLLKGRFRCLLKDRTLHYQPRVAARIMLACTVLHNMAIHYRVWHPVARWDDIDQEPQLPIPPLERDAVYRHIGQHQRRQYIERYF